MDETNQQQIARALGRIPSGAFVITARSNGRRTGMLASWVQQAGFDPPAVSVGVKKERPIAGLIDASGNFFLNVLGSDPTPMFRHFGRGFSLEDDAFAGLDASDALGGVALPQRIAGMACRVRSRFDAGDHWLYVGEVIAADGDESKAPYVHLRKNGLNY